jgi:hypothetical protein
VDRIEIRLECLRLAVDNSSVHAIKDPAALAETYFEFVTKPEDKLKAPRRKPVSKAE